MNHIYLLLILIVPMSWPWISKLIWPHEITVKEILLHLGIVLFVTSGVYYIGMVGQSMDVEIWNGEVTGKEKVWVSCEHSYSCNCTTDKDGNESCDTCYDHSNDWDWQVYSNINDTETIARVDRRGSNEPPRWTAVKLGEPFSDEKIFKNYIKGAPDSLFNDKDLVTRYQSLIPKYPSKIHDYYRINRVIPVGISVPDIGQWNGELSEMLRILGPRKKSNVVIVIAKTDQVEYAKALKEAWLSGKKNDTVVVIGSTQYPTIDFVDVFSWSKKAILDVELRDNILSEKTIDKTKIIGIIEGQIQKNFEKRSMEEFAYLADDVVPPTWLLIVTCLVSMIASAAVSYWTYNENIFDERGSNTWKHRRVSR